MGTALHLQGPAFKTELVGQVCYICAAVADLQQQLRESANAYEQLVCLLCAIGTAVDLQVPAFKRKLVCKVHLLCAAVTALHL